MSMSSSITQSGSSASTRHDVDKLDQLSTFVDFFEHFGKWYTLIIQHHFFQLSHFDNNLHILQHLAELFNFFAPHDFITTKHNDLVSQRGIFNIFQLTVIFDVFELPLTVLRCIDNVSLIYEQLNKHLVLQLVLQLVSQLKLVKKLHIITYKQFDHKSNPYSDVPVH
ncbi:hypothetical protein KC357_g5325 [Hortaea werneckii]|nr:hypothetical protein KC357_g5325 [Hortaea werneckii]